MNIVVYTAIIGNIDRLWSALPGGHDAQHVAFVDAPKFEVGLWGEQPPRILGNTGGIGGQPTWEQRVVTAEWGNRRAARHYKALPHRYLPDADVWVWVDGNVRLREHPAAFVARYLHGDLAIPKHPDRDCAYVEAAFCARRGKDRAETLTRQAQAYRKAGLPERWGLAETRVVIRRNTPEIVALNEAWWAEIKRHSLRDQVSLPFVCWKSGVRWNVIPGRVNGDKHPHVWHTGRHK